MTAAAQPTRKRTARQLAAGAALLLLGVLAQPVPAALASPSDGPATPGLVVSDVRANDYPTLPHQSGPARHNLTGTVTNNGPYVFQYVEVVGVALDADGNVVERAYSSDTLPLMPGQARAFTIPLPAAHSHVIEKATGAQAQAPHSEQWLVEDVHEVPAVHPESMYRQYEGRVVNSTDVPARPRLQVTLVDDAGKPVHSQFATVTDQSSDAIPPGEARGIAFSIDKRLPPARVEVHASSLQPVSPAPAAIELRGPTFRGYAGSPERVPPGTAAQLMVRVSRSFTPYYAQDTGFELVSRSVGSSDAWAPVPGAWKNYAQGDWVPVNWTPSRSAEYAVRLPSFQGQKYVADQSASFVVEVDESSRKPSVSLSPGIITAGQRVTVYYSGTPNTTLDVLSKTQPATSFSRIATVTLDANGRGITSHAPHRNTRMMARTSTGQVSDQPLIQVRSVASINARRTAPRTYAFTGTVSPALAGRLVSLYRNGTLVAQGRTSSTGVYSISKTLAAGNFGFSVRTPNDTYNLGATSRTLSIRVY